MYWTELRAMNMSEIRNSALAFMAETRDNVYAVIITEDGQKRYTVNNSVVDSLPVTRTTKILLSAIADCEPAIKDRLNLLCSGNGDTPEGRACWWAITEKFS